MTAWKPIGLRLPANRNRDDRLERNRTNSKLKIEITLSIGGNESYG